jgi:5'(3')-deoxyribonucleotidase
MKKKPVLIDCDGVVCDFISKCLSVINEKNRTNILFESIDKDIRKVCKKYWDKEMDDLLESDGFAQTFDMIPGTKEGIEKLKEAGFKIIYLTSPYYGSKTWAHDRLKWLEKHLRVNRNDVIFARTKQYTSGITLIDDKVENIRAWSKYNSQQALLLDQPWNKNALASPLVRRVCDLKEAASVIIEWNKAPRHKQLAETEQINKQRREMLRAAKTADFETPDFGDAYNTLKIRF